MTSKTIRDPDTGHVWPAKTGTAADVYWNYHQCARCGGTRSRVELDACPKGVEAAQPAPDPWGEAVKRAVKRDPWDFRR